jgi:glycosyltransferase involved in cell wall biosynthesis
VLATLPDAGPVLVDGLVASAVPDVLTPAAGRLRVVPLVHMPLGDGDPGRRDDERRVLDHAAAVVTTSRWSGRRLTELYGLPPDRLHVAPPGVDPAPPVPGSPGGTRLLCVAAVTPGKGQRELVSALATLAARDWTLACVGALDRDPAYADDLRTRVDGSGLAGRVRLTGPLTGADLDAAYADADLLVLASRAETYGMVVTEALARGIPVLATEVGGVPEAMGHAPDGTRPGLLVPPADPTALARALARWLDEPGLRDRVRRSARARRATLSGWDVTAALVGRALAGATVAASR